ncbi:MAG: NADH oxidoreductase hcr [Pelotomaculum sp. PtaU1.Bin035]|nr:MAG: NADH oxidoreductase hcr [Pelotomaculum sp. PtaU1.Bin035]
MRFFPGGRQVVIGEYESLIKAMTKANIPIVASCGGEGVCSRCKVLIKEGQVKSLSTGKLTGEEQEQGYVLACRSFPESHLVVEVSEESKLGVHQVVLGEGGGNLKGRADGSKPGDSILSGSNGLCAGGSGVPLFRKLCLVMPEPDINDSEDDLGRLVRVIRSVTGIKHLQTNLDVLRTLPQVLRQSGWKVTVSLTGDGRYQAVEITEVEPGHTAGQYYGLAVDIGTTSVVAQLVDLENGRVVGIKGTYNKQAAFGDDVISRIIFASEGGLGELQKAIVDTINELIEELAKEQKIKPVDIRAVVCAGNTTMSHLFLGIDPTFIRIEPYTPATNSIPAVRAGHAGLNTHPLALIRCLPGIGSYVGGDITAGVLITGMAFSGKLTLFIDIGTNGEIVLGNQEWLISCACSAGPAFEGGGLRHGMRAMRGAIEHIKIASGGADVEYKTVGGAPPVGICGSGLIDCVAGLYRAGIIDRGGNFITAGSTPRLRESIEGMEFVVSWSGESGGRVDITISEAEVKNLIRSKAAVYAGIRCMLQTVGLPAEAIDRIIIAGGFGQYINVRDAVNIGLLPDVPVEKYSYVGNSSVKGAQTALISGRAWEEIDEIIHKMTYMELSAGSTFMDEFVSALFIPHTDLNLFPSAQS